ncbi:CRTAC1 family protein [Paenibacillus chitinolyticus]|uniref:CRTAC1 family protein n=1 Tax=Paenibacillus chitinolyticus TaxID=79263 RepID=UPI001C4891DE|nr:CRTAC1 family protein [Paenibacillus chitinolyticus]MBV6713701.1 CRTAC1 family protein [Paenibacillus chitinolyticus]
MQVKPLSKMLLAVSALLLTATGCGAGQNRTDFGFSLKETTQASGVKFTHSKPTFDSKVANIMPWMASTGAGVFTADYDGDGFMDLYFVNSAKGSKNALFHNNGDGTFTETAESAGLADVNKDGISEAAVWFDYDNSGYPSLFVGSWGKSRLFHNNGNGTFTEVTDQAGVGYKGYVNKAIVLDYNKDGNLDLYLSCYFHEKNDLWNLTTTKIMHNDFERARNGGRNVLYRNNGDGTFTDVTAELGVGDTGWTLASGTWDVNNDGWPDIYNANDFGPDTLYLNEEGKKFTAVVQPRGIGDDTFKGMNVDFADIFHDGKPAMYVSNVSKSQYILEGNQLWHEKDGQFIDRGKEMGVNLAGFSWGARFMDLDNSGKSSLVVQTGFVSASKKKDYWFDLGTLATTPGNIVEDTKNWPAFVDKSLSGYENKFLFYPQGNKFTDIAEQVGLDFVEDGRGISAVDIRNQGKLDLVFANQGGPARVYENTVTNQNNWIKLDLIGTAPSSRDAIGARVTFEVNGVETVMEKDGANSFGGQSDPRLHFGLGKADKADKITVRWPSGRVEQFRDVPKNQILRLTEKKD